jgi:hypothetical protein
MLLEPAHVPASAQPGSVPLTHLTVHRLSRTLFWSWKRTSRSRPGQVWPSNTAEV